VDKSPFGAEACDDEFRQCAMRSVVKLLGVVLLVLAALGLASVAYVRVTGLRAATEPGPLETRIARSVRSLAIPQAERQRANPVPGSAAAVADGLAHFADHCAICHANDGSGNTEVGRGLFPKPPDMRAAATQGLTDGELFYIIENGIRFTGMPAFGTGEGRGEDSWHLVHFIRELPRLTREQIERMEALNPRAPDEIRQQIAEEEFLKGGGTTPPPTGKPHAH
jgi:mono/diheme cytochrome c family protein